MLERHIHSLRVERPASDETLAAARARLGEKFPRTALRRMTHLGLLVGAALDGIAPGPDDALVYATTFAETRALEDYLASFPTPSPLLFQTSIHPGAVQQVMIGRQQPLGRFWPLTGRRRLVEHALLTALLEPAPRVLLVGGEERGTWMLEHHMASDRAFAFALALTSEPAGAAGRVTFVPASSGTGFLPVSLAKHGQDAHATSDGPCPSLAGFTDALAERRPLHWRGAGGAWSIVWS